MMSISTSPLSPEKRTGVPCTTDSRFGGGLALRQRLNRTVSKKVKRERGSMHALRESPMPCVRFDWYLSVLPMLATLHIRSQKRQFSPSNFADAIRLFPPSSQGLACDRKGVIISITAAFSSVPRCNPPFSRAARLHMLYYWMRVRRYSPSVSCSTCNNRS